MHVDKFIVGRQCNGYKMECLNTMFSLPGYMSTYKGFVRVKNIPTLFLASRCIIFFRQSGYRRSECMV